MKHIFVILLMLIMPLFALSQTEPDNSVKKFNRFSFHTDFERTSSNINLHNIAGLCGVNIAGGHISISGGFTLSYAWRKEDANVWTSKRWDKEKKQTIVTNEKDIIEYEINKFLPGITIDIYYQILKKSMFSPVVRARATNFFSNNHDYKTLATGIACNLPHSGNTIICTIGCSKFHYMIKNSQEEFFNQALFVWNLGITF